MNFINLDYFDLHFDKSYDEREIVTIDKDLYFKSIILFVERIKNIIIIPKIMS